MTNISSKLTNTDASKINYFNKMKTELKITKILYTSDSFYKLQYNGYYKDYKKLIVARPKNMISLKLVPVGVGLDTNKSKYRFINMTITNLDLDMHLHEERIYFDGAYITPQMELTALVDLLKNINIKKLTINLCYESPRNTELRLLNVLLLQYCQQMQYLRQHIQKYCNDMQVDIFFWGHGYDVDFWNNTKGTAINTCIVIYDRYYGLLKSGNKYWGMIDKTKSNFHRNFKLEKRKINRILYKNANKLIL